MTEACEGLVACGPAGNVQDHATVGDLLVELTDYLRTRGSDEGGAEAREIIAALHDVPRSWPLLNRSMPVEQAVRMQARAAADMRARGAPFAYAVGRAPFRHLTLDVDERVLIPRPETEQLVDLVLGLVAGRDGGVAVDVGTGSGAIAIALASEGRFDRVLGTDVSRDALDVAAQNVRLSTRLLRGPVQLLHGSSLAPVDRMENGLRVVVANPPYVSYAEAAALPRGVRDWEPPVALFSGAGGLQATAQLVREAAGLLEPDGILALEADVRRASLVAELVTDDRRYRAVSVHLDLFGRERFVIARR